MHRTFGTPSSAIKNSRPQRPLSLRPTDRASALLLGALCLLLGGAGGCSNREDAALKDESNYNEIKAAGAISATASITPATAKAGEEVSILATITSSRATIVDVIAAVRGPAGVSVYSVELAAQTIQAEESVQLEDVLALEPTDPAGIYVLSMAVRHTGTGKMLLEQASAAEFILSDGQSSGACSGTTVFCDDYTNPALANSYTIQRGTWTRGTKTYTVTDSVVWERARAQLAGDYSDFDVTLTGRSLGDAGFGLSYGAQAIDDGFAVIVHPAQFQGVYLKELVPGGQDINMKSYPLPAAAAGKSMSLRVRRVGTAVTVWLDGTQVLTGDDGGTGRHGRLGLVLSVTDQTSGSGAEFSLLRLDSATPVGTCTPQCSGKECGSDGCDGSCGSCASGLICNTVGACVTAATGTWLSGASGDYTVDGSFGNWRGRPVEIGGTWDDSSLDRQTNLESIVSGDWANWQGPLDIAIGGIFKESGDTWSAAASGAYDSRWRGVLNLLKTHRSGKGTTYIRFAHEFNGNWWPNLWMVTGAEVNDFKKAWQRFHTLQQEIFPSAKLVWCPNDGTSASNGIGDIRDAFPGAAYVDVVGIDTYNQWPFADTAAELTDKWNSTESNGAPLGPETWRRFAESQGLPLAIGEWSSQATDGGGGGGDSPAYMQGMYDWLQAHAGNGAGQIEYEVLFNLWPNNYELWPDTRQPLAAAKYRELW